MPESWPPDAEPESLGPACTRCGSFVSYNYYRTWSQDGELDGCRHCLPRSVRFGQDIYDRDRDEVQAEFAGSDPQDRGNDPAPSSRISESIAAPDPIDDIDDFRADSPAALLDDDD